MPIPVQGSDTFFTGRSTAPDPTLDNVTVGANLDASAGVDSMFEFGSVNDTQIYGVPRSAYIDNGTGPNPITVEVSITGQTFTVPPFAQGYFPLNATERSTITISGDGGNTSPVNVQVFNTEKPAQVWYAAGQNNPLSATSIQGSISEGADVATATNNIPVYVAGIDRSTGLLHAISVDATGIIDVAITGGIGPVAVSNFPANNGAYSDESIAALSGASEALIAANPARRLLVINNPNAANPIAVNLSGGVAAINTAGSITLLAGATLTIDQFAPTNAITVIGTAGDDVTAYEA